MLTAFQLEAEKRELWHGIEAPTTELYTFTGRGKRRALIDFVLLSSNSADTPQRCVLVELKAQVGMIGKDIEKFCSEPRLAGRCLFHLCRGVDRETLATLEESYNIATRAAGESCKVRERWDWFVLYILATRPRVGDLKPYLRGYEWKNGEWSLQSQRDL